jgi:hypothetical protein
MIAKEMTNLRTKERPLLLTFLFIAFAIGPMIMLYIKHTIIMMIHDFMMTMI